MRLRTRQQYQRMTQKTVKYTGEWILADIRLTHATVSRVGVTVTKRYGPAYQRNRFKRLVREAFRLSCAHFFPTFDVVIRPRSKALQASMLSIQKELIHFIEQTIRLNSTAEDNPQSITVRQ